nr:enzyme of the cupin superfamily [Ipomoea batatas]
MATVLSGCGCFISNANNISNNRPKNRYKVVGRNFISFTSVSSVKPQAKRALRIVIRASTEPHAGVMATEKGGIKVINDPPESKLSELGVRSWPK